MQEGSCWTRPFDLVSGFANPLPIAVISDLLGVPHERADEFARFGATIGSALDGVRSPRHAAQLMRADTALHTLFDDLFVLRRREPAHDVVSLIVSAADDGQVQPPETVPLCILLLIPGSETTANLIGNVVLALLSHPDQWRAVADDPTLAAAAAEETCAGIRRCSRPDGSPCRISTSAAAMCVRASSW